MEVICKPRKWGNSLGITLPKQLVEVEKIKEGEDVIIEVRRKRVNLIKFFGRLKDAKLDAQKMKDESRKIWDM